MLLGKAGIGKSTFINAFNTYIRFDSLQQALKSEPLSVLHQVHSVCYKDISGNYINLDVETGNSEAADINLQTPKNYKFNVDNVTIQLIDTPGNADSSDSEKNHRKISEYMSTCSSVDAVCILLQPGEARLTPDFKQNMNDCLALLDKNTKENKIVFIFTNTMPAQFSPGETMKVLREFLSVYEQQNQITISTDDDRVFCVDNEPFRYIWER